MNSKLPQNKVWTVPLCLVLQTALASDALNTWHLRDSKSGGQPLYDITFGKDLFVAVGPAGTIVTSPDGVTWTPQNSGTTSSISPIIYDSGMFLSSGRSEGSADTLIRSNDGTNWTSSLWNSEDPIRGLGYANNMFFLFSSVRVGGGEERAVIYTSTNTTDWTRIDTARLGIPGAVAYGNGLYFVVGTGFGTGAVNPIPFVLTSQDAITWTGLDFDSPRYWDMQFVDVVYAQNMFFVAVYGGWIASTRSGTSWRFVSPGPIDVRSLTFGDGIFAVVGSVGSLATSTDGLVWTVRDPGTKLWLSGVAYGHNSFVVVGNEGLIFQSDPIVTLGLTQGINTELSITGPTGRTCEIQAVDELLETNRWQVLRSVTLTGTPVSWTDDGSTNKPQRFYRAVLQP